MKLFEEQLREVSKLQKQMKEAGERGDAVEANILRQEIRDNVVFMLRPEAKTVVEVARKDVTHKDGYPTVQRFLQKLPKKDRELFELAMIAEGYPKDTMNTIRELIGD